MDGSDEDHNGLDDQHELPPPNQDADSSPNNIAQRRKLNNYTPVVALMEPPATSTPNVWAEEDSLALLKAWGELYLNNKRQMRSDKKWEEVTKRVNEVPGINHTTAQCINRMDYLKSQYKKEKNKVRVAESGSSGSTWLYFEKMEEIMNPLSTQPAKDQNSSDGLGEMKKNLAGHDNNEDESDGLPPKPSKKRSASDSSSVRMLADSTQKFCDIYEKVEEQNRKDMAELLRDWMELYRDLEVQKQDFLKQQIAKFVNLKLEESDSDDDSEEAKGNDSN